MAGEPQFTKGPRSAEDREERIVVFADHYHSELASFSIGPTDTDEQFDACHEEQLANAHLDKAGPEMFAALVEAEACAVRAGWANQPRFGMALEQIRAALASARDE